MATTSVSGLTISYEVVGADPGTGGRSWVVTPGGRYSKDDPGLREMAEALAGSDGRTLIWDRPNCGASDVCFDGASESAMQADVLAGLVETLGLGPAVLAGGSGGARVALLAAARHPDAVAGVAMWWITGRPLGLLSLAMHYCSGSLKAAWDGGMEAVVERRRVAQVGPFLGMGGRQDLRMHARRPRPRHHIGAVARELAGIQVAVRIDQHRAQPRRASPSITRSSAGAGLRLRRVIIIAPMPIGTSSTSGRGSGTNRLATNSAAATRNSFG